jgi:hypothetical protein
MFGLTLGDLDDTAVEVWPENLPAVNAFIALSTQWRMGPAGPVGLDYAALPPVMRLIGLPRATWPDVFEGVRVMESEALKIMGESRG